MGIVNIIRSSSAAGGAERAGLVRRRGVVAGALLTAWINAFDPLARYLVRSSSFTDSHLPFALLLGVLAVAYVHNPWARRWCPACVKGG